jgi:hypothetical protein
MHESFVLRGFCALMLYSYGFCMTSRHRHETRPSVTSSELVYTLYTVHITLYKIINKSCINREGWPRKRFREGELRLRRLWMKSLRIRCEIHWEGSIFSPWKLICIANDSVSPALPIPTNQTWDCEEHIFGKIFQFVVLFCKTSSQKMRLHQ